MLSVCAAEKLGSKTNEHKTRRSATIFFTHRLIGSTPIKFQIHRGWALFHHNKLRDLITHPREVAAGRELKIGLAARSRYQSSCEIINVHQFVRVVEFVQGSSLDATY